MLECLGESYQFDVVQGHRLWARLAKEQPKIVDADLEQRNLDRKLRQHIFRVQKVLACVAARTAKVSNPDLTAKLLRKSRLNHTRPASFLRHEDSLGRGSS